MHIIYSLHLHACSGEGKDLMRMGLALAVLTLPHTLHLKEHWKPLWSRNRHTLNCPNAHIQSGVFSSGTKIQGDHSLPAALDANKALKSKTYWIEEWKEVSPLHLSFQPAVAALLGLTVSISQFIFPSSSRRNPVQTKQHSIYRKLGRVKKVTVKLISC